MVTVLSETVVFSDRHQNIEKRPNAINRRQIHLSYSTSVDDINWCLFLGDANYDFCDCQSVNSLLYYSKNTFTHLDMLIQY